MYINNKVGSYSEHTTNSMMKQLIRKYKEYRALRNEIVDNLNLAREYLDLDGIQRSRMLYSLSRRMVERYISTNPTYLKKANSLLEMIEKAEKSKL